MELTGRRAMGRKKLSIGHPNVKEPFRKNVAAKDLYTQKTVDAKRKRRDQRYREKPFRD